MTAQKRCQRKTIKQKRKCCKLARSLTIIPPSTKTSNSTKLTEYKKRQFENWRFFVTKMKSKSGQFSP